MNKILKEMNWKLLNILIYITLIISYIYPFELSSNKSVLIGCPL